MKNILLTISVLFFFGQNTFGQTTASDDFYSTDVIKEIRLNFKQNNWAAILDSLKVNGNEMLVGTAKLDGTSYENIGVRYRGGRSFKINGKRNPLFLKLNLINKKQKHQGYETIKLSSAVRDPSLLREVLGYEIARKYMIAPKANFVKVYVNDAFYGLFINIEAVDDEFLNKYFSNDEGTFVKCTPDANGYANGDCLPSVYSALVHEEDINCYFKNYELASDEGWDDLIQLTSMLKDESADIASILNVDQTLWMLAFNNVLVNLSSYSGRVSQNYYLYQDEQGKFVPIIWDLNLAFGSYKSAQNGSDLNLKQLQELDPLLHIDNQYKPLINRLLSNPSYKKVYLAHIRSIVYDNFENGWYEERAKELQALIRGAFIDDKNQAYEYRDFKRSLVSTIGKRSKIPGIVELMSKRSKFLKKHPELRVIPPSISEVELARREQYAAKQMEQFIISAKIDKRPKQVTVFYRYKDSGDYLQASMKDDGQAKDEKAGDSIYTVSIPNNEMGQIEYYIVAENAASINYSPANYMFERHIARIADLN